MKKFMAGVSACMMIILTISVFVFQHTSQNNPYPSSQNDWQDKQSLQKNKEQPQTEQLRPVHAEDEISYSLQNDELNITFDKGETWKTVPIEINHLFEGEYNGSKQELIEGSYVLNEDWAAFLYSAGPNWDEKRILLTYSTDQGETWHDATVAERFTVMRFRKVDFLNETFGYVIISGGRTMSQESSHVFLTHDGGDSFEETTNSERTTLISDGGFVDERTGFLSFGVINPEKPDLYVTQDGGNCWNQATFHIPETYAEIFVSAEVPVKEEDHLSILVNQGPNGDYKGGNVKGKFISEDNGSTWQFQEEVIPDETE